AGGIHGAHLPGSVFERELLEQSITQKIPFVDDQIVSRNMMNSDTGAARAIREHVPILRSGRTRCISRQMADGLASLGIVHFLLQDYGAITFEAFINLSVAITRNQASPEQLRAASRGIANDKLRDALRGIANDKLTPQWIYVTYAIKGLNNANPAYPRRHSGSKVVSDAS
ncbi:hypothetical protein FOMPIDRAFT_1021030, partial [Fomitopsis schrenkii]